MNKNPDLERYDGKPVRIVSAKGRVYTGIVDSYTQPNDNDPVGEEAVSLDTGFWFNESDIKSIEIMKVNLHN